MKTYNGKGKITIFYLIISVFLLFQGVSSFANEGDPAGATGFTYKINFPENQVNKDLGYYQLKMSAGQKQNLAISLSNPSNEKVTVEVKINGAKTNQNGVIEYGESEIPNDSSLKFDFDDVVKTVESVELGPGETKNLEVSIEMPEIAFDGVIAGGIQLMRANQTDNASSDGGSKIINQYAYVIGMVLQETDTVINPELALNSVKAGQSNYRNAIFVNFSNVMAEYLNDITVEVQITEKGKETILYERKQTAMRMAPNSFIDFPVSMNGERMVQGDYEANILVTSGDKKWAWKESFKITDKDANKFNERDVGLVQEKGIDWQLVILIVLSLISVIIVIFLVLRFIRKKKKAKKIAQKKKKRKKISSN